MSVFKIRQESLFHCNSVAVAQIPTTMLWLNPQIQNRELAVKKLEYESQSEPKSNTNQLPTAH